MTGEKKSKLKNMVVLVIGRVETECLRSKYSQVCLVSNITQLLDCKQNLTYFHTEPAFF